MSMTEHYRVHAVIGDFVTVRLSHRQWGAWPDNGLGDNSSVKPQPSLALALK
jgi:hypothetical protein